MTKRGKLENGGIAKLLEELDAPDFSGLVNLHEKVKAELASSKN